MTQKEVEARIEEGVRKKSLKHDFLVQDALACLLPVLDLIKSGLENLSNQETMFQAQAAELERLHAAAAAVPSTPRGQSSDGNFTSHSEMKKSHMLVAVLEKQLDHANKRQRDAVTEADIATSKLEACLWQNESLKRSNAQLLDTIQNLKGMNDSLQEEKEKLGENLELSIAAFEARFQLLSEALKKAQSDSTNDRTSFKGAISSLNQQLQAREKENIALAKSNSSLTSRVTLLTHELRQAQRQQDPSVTVLSPKKFRDVVTAESSVQTEAEVSEEMSGEAEVDIHTSILRALGRPVGATDFFWGTAPVLLFHCQYGFVWMMIALTVEILIFHSQIERSGSGGQTRCRLKRS